MSWVSKTAEKDGLVSAPLPYLGARRGVPSGVSISEMALKGYWICECGHVEPLGATGVTAAMFCLCGRRMKVRKDL